LVPGGKKTVLVMGLEGLEGSVEVEGVRPLVETHGKSEKGLLSLFANKSEKTKRALPANTSYNSLGNRGGRTRATGILFPET